MRDTVTVSFQESNAECAEWITYHISKAYLEQSGRFEFSTSWDKLAKTLGLSFQYELIFQPISIDVNGRPWMSGIIYTQEMSDDGVLTFSGKDYLSRLSGDLNPSIAIASGSKLKDAILKCILPFGFSSISDNNDVWRQFQSGYSATTEDYGLGSMTTQYEKTNNGGSTWSFVNKLAAKHSLTLQPTDQNVNLSLARPNFAQGIAFTLSRNSEGGAQNILSAHCRRDYEHMCSVVKAVGSTGQASTKFSGVSGLITPEDQSPTTAELQFIMTNRILPASNAILLPKSADDFKVKDGSGSYQGLVWNGKNIIYNPLFIKDHDCKSKDELQSRIKREYAERFKETLHYSCSVSGHTEVATGLGYTVDLMAHVSDDVHQVNELLWISECSLSLTESQGQTSELVMIRPESFSIA